MRHRAKLRVASIITSLGAGALLVLPSAARASTPVSLPITSFYQIVADTAHGHLFISEGSSSINHILVTDLTGQQVTTIAGQNGVMGINLSPDGKTLYAALSANHAVTAIDTSTLQQTASYPIGSMNTPQDVAVQSGKVWVSYATATPAAAAIGDIDLSAKLPAFQAQPGLGSFYNPPELAADPQDSGFLVAAVPNLTPAPLASFNTSVDPPTVRAALSTANCEQEEDLAVVPGGTELITACGAPYANYRFSTTDLSEQGSFASTTYPSAVAIAANGTVAVGTKYGDPSKPDMYFYAPNGDTPLNTLNFGSSSAGVASRGLAWSADASQLFAVLQDSVGGNTYSLQVIDDPTLAGSTLSLAGPSTAILGKSVALTGSLTLTAGGTLPAGTPVTVTRSVSGAADKVFDLTTAADGSFSLTDTPPALGHYTYTANYAGSTTVAPAAASHTVAITLKPPALTLTTGRSTVRYLSTVHLTAHLGPTHTNRTVSIYAQTVGSRHRVLLKTGRVNSRGDLTVSYVARHSVMFSVVFAGDAQDGQATVKRMVNVFAKVTMTVRGNYGTRRVGHHTYLLYHRSGHVDVAVTVAPNKHGQCVVVQVQSYFRGAWHPNTTTNCALLSSTSHVLGYLTVNQASLNIPYRLRAIYLRSNGDISNLSTAASWHYVLVER